MQLRYPSRAGTHSRHGARLPAARHRVRASIRARNGRSSMGESTKPSSHGLLRGLVLSAAFAVALLGVDAASASTPAFAEILPAPVVIPAPVVVPAPVVIPAPVVVPAPVVAPPDPVLPAPLAAPAPVVLAA